MPMATCLMIFKAQFPVPVSDVIGLDKPFLKGRIDGKYFYKITDLLCNQISCSQVDS